MDREFRKGESIVEAQARWKLEDHRRELERRRQQIEAGRLRGELTKTRKKKRGEERKAERLIRNAKIEAERFAAIPIPSPIKYVPGNKKLSILICSIRSRSRILQNLLVSLKKQIITKDIEILVETDNKEITIGVKRNILLRKALGDYITFIDDDDKISRDYICKILSAISTFPDCCGIEGEISFRKRITRKFIHSIRYDRWFELNGIYYRCPNHLNPVRREIASQVAFPNVSKREDEHYSLRIKPLLKTEVYIEGTIYFYGAD